MTILESNFKNKLMERLKQFENSFFFSKEAMAIRGLPDIVGVYKGRFIALEVKRDHYGANRKTGRTVLQRYILLLIKKAGGYASFIYPENYDEVIAEINSF